MNGTCRRQVKDNRTKTWGRRQFQRATIIPVYNNNMGGTDPKLDYADVYPPSQHWVCEHIYHHTRPVQEDQRIAANLTEPPTGLST